jgi:CheY-like chemotaxis protein
VKTILIVEDEPTIAHVLQFMLQYEGYQVVIAVNGRQGLDKLAEVGPDLVISDVMMPVLSGTEMYQIMQADPVLSQIPVVLMSSADAVYPNIDRKHNYIGFLQKPFDIEKLMSHVVSAIGSPQ